MPSCLSSVAALAAALSLFSTSVAAHMMMAQPVPYGKSTLDNSPLLADGSDFPCKQRPGVYDLEGASNVLAIGETQTLSFIGSAVHGGGSCQVSLTTDLQPTKNSTWMVIHSIEGNCPSNVTGNLPDNADGTGAAVFQYTIPEGIKPGEYTIAWSWVNKIGNREFYMNCGPATVTGAKKKRYAPASKSPVKRAQTSFPPMFVANLAGVSDGCTTTEGVDIKYPDPGPSVQLGTIDVNFGDPVGCTGNEAQVSAQAPSESAAATATQSAGTESTQPGSFATGTNTAPAVPGLTSTAVVSPVPAAQTQASSVAPSAPSSTASTEGSTAGAQSGPCTDEGEWFCSSDGASFQRCASGAWSAAIPMAQGTTCTPGLSDNLTINGKTKRQTGHERRASNLSRRRSSGPLVDA